MKAAKSVNTIKDAGTYSNFVITPKADMNVSLSNSQPSFSLQGTITVTPQTLTVIPNNPGSINEGGALPESYTYTNTGAVKGETPVFEGTLSIKDESGNEVTDSNTPGKYEVYQGSLKLVNGNNFTATNYQLQVKSGVYLTIIDDISDNDIKISVDKNTWEYNGNRVSAEDIVKVEGLPAGSYDITTKVNDKAAPLQNVGEYTIVLSGKGSGYIGSKEFESPTITITPKAITGIKAADQEIELGGTVKTDAAQNPEIVTVAGLIPGEEAVFTSGTIQVDANTNVAGVYKNALTIQSLEVAESNSQTGFLKNNYSGWEKFTTSTYGKGTLTVTDAQDPINYYNIYNETTYDFIDVSFSRNVVREGGSVNVYLEIPEGLDPAAVSLMFKRSLYGGWENLNTDDDGNYPIRNIWTDIYVKAVVDESYIDPNPDENHIYIDLSETNDSIWLYTERKLVEEGKSAVIQAEVAKSCQNKEIRYMYKRTVLGEWKEMPKGYSINQYVVRDITTDIYVKAYFVFDKQDPTTAKNPHHVYADITATCEGLYLDATRHKVADEGDTKVFLYVKKGFETKDARYLFKRGLKGEWEDLVPGIEQNTFQVTDIEGDIYLKGIDAVYTGTEDIDGMVRVYTKDGSLFVYTAQPEEISVVSMTGVTVKRTRQTGLQSYPLNQGIYVVRVGEQVFKVRVK